LLEIAELDDAEMDAVLAVLLPRLRKRSGLELNVFHAMVSATLIGAGTRSAPRYLSRRQ